jgi:hypothetical protein
MDETLSGRPLSVVINLADPRVAVRDQLLDAIVSHVRRRGDDYLAQLIRRILVVVRANDDRIDEAAVAAEVSLAKPQPTCSGAPRSFKPSTGPRPRAWFEARATAIFRPSALHGHTGVTMEDGERTGWAAALDL